MQIDEILRDGKEKVVRRSQFTDWNYAAEISAFQSRVGEQFDDDKLIQSFKTRDYLEHLILQHGRTFGSETAGSLMESEEYDGDIYQGKTFELSKKELETVEANSNQSLSIVGGDLIDATLKAFVRTALPYLPEEGVDAIKNFLTTEEMLAHISFHVGTKDLILSKEYPPSRATMANVLRSLVGALSLSESALDGNGKDRAVGFILDVVGSQLHGKDITDIWDVENAVGVLTQILTNDGRSHPEFRLLWASGQDTILACFHIGVYCDKELIGQSPGESVEIAQDMAARDCLRRLFRFDDASTPIPFGKMDAQLLKFTPNSSISEWSEHKIKNLVIV